MATGRDIAKFVSQMTGQDYVGLYDEAEAQDGALKMEAQNKFKDMVKRMNFAEKKNIKDVID